MPDDNTDQTDAPIDSPPDQTDAPPATGEPDWKAEAEKWKRLSRENEQRAKGNAKKLEELQAAQMSEAERAVAEAEKRGESMAMAKVGQRLAAAEIRAALTGVVPDPAVIIEDLNLARYVNEQGEVDAAAVTALRDKFAGIAAKPPSTPPPGAADAGARGGQSAGQLTQADLKGMTPEQIVEAKAKGQLNDLLGKR